MFIILYFSNKLKYKSCLLISHILLLLTCYYVCLLFPLALPLSFTRVILGLIFKYLYFSRRYVAKDPKTLKKRKLREAVNSYFDFLINVHWVQIWLWSWITKPSLFSPACGQQKSTMRSAASAQGGTETGLLLYLSKSKPQHMLHELLCESLKSTYTNT